MEASPEWLRPVLLWGRKATFSLGLFPTFSLVTGTERVKKMGGDSFTTGPQRKEEKKKGLHL